MRNGFLGSLGLWLTGAGLAFAQVPYGYAPVMPSYAPGYSYYGSGYGYSPGYQMNFASGPPATPGTLPVNGVAPNPTIVQTGATVPGRSMTLQAAPPEILRNAPAENGPALPPAPPASAPPVAQEPAAPPAPAPGAPAIATLPDGAPVDGGVDHDHVSPGGSCASGHCGDDFPPQTWCTCEYLLWKFKEAPLPTPVLTEGDLALAPPMIPGALNAGGTSVVSPSQFNYNMASGGRLTLGGWFTSTRSIGMDCSGFVLQRQTSNFGISSSQGAGLTQVLAVPYYDLATNAESAIVLSDPALNPATVSIQNRIFLWGAECNVLSQLFGNRWFSLGVLAGCRHLELTESLDYNVAITSTDLAPNPSATFSSTDHFGTRNSFWGGQVGGRAEVRFDRFFANVTGKVAVGPMYEVVTANGTSTNNNNALGTTVTIPVGILVQQTNTGKASQDHFAVVPEVQAQVGVQIVRWLRLFGGYNFLYVSSVVRPGDQIDRNMNSANFPPGFLGVLPPGSSSLPVAISQPFHPSIPLSTASFWAQGVNVGVELRY